MLKPYIDLPQCFRNEECMRYYNILEKKKASLLLKRAFDILVSLVLLILLLPALAIISILIKLDSRGPVIFKQKRVTTYNRDFYIYKFRTMVNNAEKLGSQVTVSNDSRITKVGKVLRKFRLDEIPQLLNILKGDMSFVGTRPEVRRYVEGYEDKFYATLLMPAGVTSLASICYKDEEKLLESAEDVDSIYLSKILPDKMKYNLSYIEKFSFIGDIKLMIMTVLAVCGMEFDNNIEKTKEQEEQYV